MVLKLAVLLEVNPGFDVIVDDGVTVMIGAVAWMGYVTLRQLWFDAVAAVVAGVVVVVVVGGVARFLLVVLAFVELLCHIQDSFVVNSHT